MKTHHDQALGFARDWIAAWNRHDLAAVLDHYTEDFEMCSPLISEFAGEPSGTLAGKARIEAYWRNALAKMPGLQFELMRVFVGTASMVICYKSNYGRTAAETLFFGNTGKVTRAVAHYADGGQSGFECGSWTGAFAAL